MDYTLKRHAELGVTGALLYTSGYFMQLLEGPQQTVEQLFAQIQSDTCHTNVQAIVFDNASAAHFSDWHMSVINKECSTHSNRAKMEKLYNHFAESHANPYSALDYLSAFLAPSYSQPIQLISFPYQAAV